IEATETIPATEQELPQPQADTESGTDSDSDESVPELQGLLESLSKNLRKSSLSSQNQMSTKSSASDTYTVLREAKTEDLSQQAELAAAEKFKVQGEAVSHIHENTDSSCTRSE
uniref:Uncharacterized protein n=1 Tax=Sciurus vulgaris TaxID=55149 RepID=A0A8D2ATK5_SCIVU